MFLNIIWRASSMFVFQIKEPDINGCILDSISPNEFIGTKHSDKRSSVQNAQSVCSIPSIHNQRKFLIKILFLVSCFVASLVGRCFNINSKEINNGQQRKSPKPQTNHNTENYLRDTIKNLWTYTERVPHSLGFSYSHFGAIPFLKDYCVCTCERVIFSLSLSLLLRCSSMYTDKLLFIFFVFLSSSSLQTHTYRLLLTVDSPCWCWSS